jgi:nitroreductase
MDTFDCIATKLDVREFISKDVSSEIRKEILEAARLTGTGLNTQHWRFIIVAERDNLEKLAQDSTSGGWVSGANFAIIVLTNPKYGFHTIDAGRVVQNMQLAAWNRGVYSCLFTGINEARLRKDFGIPEELSPTVIVGFGYSPRKLSGKKKNRLPIDTLVYNERYR